MNVAEGAIAPIYSPATYRSREFSDFASTMWCTDAYGTVVEQIGSALREGRAIGYWEPARLVRGLLDYKIDHPRTLEDVPELVDQAIGLVVDIHAGTANAETFELFAREVEQLPKLEASKLKQSVDSISARNSNPILSHNTARELHGHTDGADLLMIVLGHGGVTAGATVYSHYVDLSGGGDSAIYPVRFSTQKLEDKKPHVNPAEKRHLLALAADRSGVVIFDEDCYSGLTLHSAKRYFDKLLKRDTLPVANKCPNSVVLIGASALREVTKGKFD